MDKIRIVIADDEASLRMLVSAAIESDECEVLEAVDGNEALALIELHRPAVAILDVQMPGKTGIEVTQIIKGNETLKSTYVVLLTSKSQAGDRAAGLAAGADEYLTKPFSPLDLISLLEPLIAEQ